jgi:hypothetical protein
MRKLTAICFALLVTVSAVAAPPNDSSERKTPNPFARIIRQIIRVLDLGQPVPPQPEAPTPTP